MAIPAERLEADGIRHLERLTALKAHYAAKGLPSGVTNTPLPHIGERDSSRMTTEAQRRKANAGQPSNPPATIKIVLEAINRRGRSSASLPDGTVLVGSSRQPFLDAARVLIAAGYDPDSWLEGWRPLVWAHSRLTPPRRNSSEGDSGARDVISGREESNSIVVLPPSENDTQGSPHIRNDTLTNERPVLPARKRGVR